MRVGCLLYTCASIYIVFIQYINMDKMIDAHILPRTIHCGPWQQRIISIRVGELSKHFIRRCPGVHARMRLVVVVQIEIK